VEFLSHPPFFHLPFVAYEDLTTIILEFKTFPYHFLPILLGCLQHFLTLVADYILLHICSKQQLWSKKEHQLLGNSQSARRIIHIAFLVERAEDIYEVLVYKRKYWLFQPVDSMIKLAFPVFRKNVLTNHLAFIELLNGT
jgi:hypothetical protein